MTTIDEDAVRARAYQLWEEGGRIDGDHEEHWRRAWAEGAAAGDGAGHGAGDGLGAADAADDSSARGGPGGASAAAPSGIDGGISRPLVDVTPKPRRWPTPIIDG